MKQVNKRIKDAIDITGTVKKRKSQPTMWEYKMYIFIKYKYIFLLEKLISIVVLPYFLWIYLYLFSLFNELKFPFFRESRRKRDTSLKDTTGLLILGQDELDAFLSKHDYYI